MQPISPNCPICGKTMVLRKGKSKFWGCSSFPRCRGTKSFASVTDYKPKQINPSAYQQAVKDFVLNESGNAVVKAVAGSGKTTTIEWISQFLPKDKDIVYLVFNSHVREEASKKMPSWVTVQTTHQLGFQAIRNNLGYNIKVEDNKVDKIIKQLINQTWDDEKWMIPAVSRLVGLCKNLLIEPTDTELDKLANFYGIEVNDSAIRIYELARLSLNESNKNQAVIDFNDMLYLPIKLNLSIPKFDWILADECFPYKTPILMKNNINLSIGKIVEEKIEGEVLTYNIENGTQEYKKITGWHKIPNSKQLVKVLAVQFPNCNGGHRAAVTCTVDHRIFTKEDGWVEAEKLKPGYHHIQRETLAKTSQSYKITGKGKKVLSKTITKNNKLGKTGNSHKRFSGVFEEKNRGGNGKGLTEPQKIYLERLGSDWEAEYSVVPTREQRLKYKSATHYKIDVANPELKIAIELDKSLTKAAKIYKKKDKILEELGWKVYHLENNFAVQNIENIITEIYENDCPVWCQVTSVEETQVKEFYVYDITVEDNHNFYANGVLVHNCQDFNNSQIELILRARKTNGRVLAVGDPDQSLYGFRGSNIDAFDNVKKGLDAIELPLSISYRVPLCGVQMVNKEFPSIQFEAFENATQGNITDVSKELFLSKVVDGDMVLCRTNAPLIGPCFDLIRQGRKAIIVGREIGQGLINFINKFNQTRVSVLLNKLDDYRIKESGKLAKREAFTQIQALDDKIDTIIALSDGCVRTSEIIAKINKVFGDTTYGVSFSTVHRAKGLEANNVFILEPQLLPHPMAKKYWEKQQEENAAYVAYTRFKNTLTFVR